MLSPILRNAAAILVALVTGSLVNILLVSLGPLLVPPPEGIDMTDIDSIAASMHLLGPQHFLFPFLAHALGTLVGATVAYLMAGRNPRLLALGIGVFFLLGGITAARMIPAPAWFLVTDLALAYLPMAGLAILLGARIKSRLESLRAGL